MMETANRFASLAAVAVVAAVVNLGIINESAEGQSPVVFMTADDASFNSHLYRFDDGTETFAVDSGEGEGFLGVTVQNGTLLVADYLNDLIRRFDSDGTYLGTFGTFSGSPTFLESDSNGNIYTTLFSFLPDDPKVSLRLNAVGTVTATYPAGNKGIDADAAGNAYVVDGTNLLKFAPNGSLVNSTPLGINGQDISIDEAANLLYMAVAGGDTSAIRIFDISGAAPVSAGSITTPAGSNFAGIHYAAESGNILATNLGFPSEVAKGLEFSASGTLLREYFPTGARAALDIITFVPEPSSILLFVVGIAATAMGRRRVRD